ncbi:hypothetical protein [Cumulibacter manganitolerans]|uniref:hypothetical protein n=1 Tax=Cumulibacter manganitolerans TaxID=1884992 RepID=UPI001295BEE5|nr:hypothetical protein [Cumulibacter manganitolerans]
MSLFDGAVAGDRDPDEQNPLVLWSLVAALVGCTVLWVFFGQAPVTRFLLAAPVVGLVVMIGTYGVRQVRPDDAPPVYRAAAASAMSGPAQWQAARFRHDELARDYLPYQENPALRRRLPGLGSAADPATAAFREALQRATLSRTSIYPGAAMTATYAEAVRRLAHEWALLKRTIER